MNLLDVCERENAATCSRLAGRWKTSQPDMRQHVDEMMAGIDAAMGQIDKRLYAAAEKEFKERSLDGRECYQLDGGTFISQESFERHLRRPTRPLHGMEEPGRTRQTRERMG